MTEPLRLAGVSKEEALHALDGLRGDFVQIMRLHRAIEVAYLLLSRPGVLEATGLCASNGDQVVVYVVLDAGWDDHTSLQGVYATREAAEAEAAEIRRQGSDYVVVEEWPVQGTGA